MIDAPQSPKGTLTREEVEARLAALPRVVRLTVQRVLLLTLTIEQPQARARNATTLRRIHQEVFGT